MKLLGGETWEDDAQRSARFEAETMTKEQQVWNANPDSPRLPLSKCFQGMIAV